MELIKSKVLKCEIVICARNEKSKAKKKYPGKVIYFHDEIESLKGLKPKEIRGLHDIKDILGGHIDPPKGKGKKVPLTLSEMRSKK